MNLMQRVAAIFGVVFLIAGALGFMVTGVVMPGMHENMEAAPKLLGLFPVNVAHNLVHVAFGIWGVAASCRSGAAALFALVSGVAYAALAVAGAFSTSLAGIIPIGGYDVGLHLAVAVVLIGSSVYSATVESDAGVPSSTDVRG